MMFLAVLSAPRRGFGFAPQFSVSDIQVDAEVTAMSAADSYGAVLISATGSMPRSVSASGIALSTARVLIDVPVVSGLDCINGFRASPLHLIHYGSDALHRVVLGGHRA